MRNSGWQELKRKQGFGILRLLHDTLKLRPSPLERVYPSPLRVRVCNLPVMGKEMEGASLKGEQETRYLVGARVALHQICRTQFAQLCAGESFRTSTANDRSRMAPVRLDPPHGTIEAATSMVTPPPNQRKQVPPYGTAPTVPLDCRGQLLSQT